MYIHVVLVSWAGMQYGEILHKCRQVLLPCIIPKLTYFVLHNTVSFFFFLACLFVFCILLVLLVHKGRSTNEQVRELLDVILPSLEVCAYW